MFITLIKPYPVYNKQTHVKSYCGYEIVRTKMSITGRIRWLKMLICTSLILLSGTDYININVKYVEISSVCILLMFTLLKNSNFQAPRKLSKYCSDLLSEPTTTICFPFSNEFMMSKVKYTTHSLFLTRSAGYPLIYKGKLMWSDPHYLPPLITNRRGVKLIWIKNSVSAT